MKIPSTDIELVEGDETVAVYNDMEDLMTDKEKEKWKKFHKLFTRLEDDSEAFYRRAEELKELLSQVPTTKELESRAWKKFRDEDK